MNFSRFFKYSFFIFLLGLQAKQTESIGIKKDLRNFGHPLVYKIPNLPQEHLLPYQAILADKVNRLFVTNCQTVVIYDGQNHQQVKIQGNPKVCSNGSNQFAIGGKGQLSLFTLDSNDQYLIQPLIKLDDKFDYQISSMAFDRENVLYFATGSKLWVFDGRPQLIDSADSDFNIYKTPNGLIFQNGKTFYTIKDHQLIHLNALNQAKNILNIFTIGKDQFVVTSKFPWFYNLKHSSQGYSVKVTRYLNEKEEIAEALCAGSYFFIITSNGRVLTFNAEGDLIFVLEDLSAFNYQHPVSIATADDVNFFAVTPTQTFGFFLPELIGKFGMGEGLKGEVSAYIKVGEVSYVTTSNGIYISSEFTANQFDLIKAGRFDDLCYAQNSIFASGADGLYLVKGRKAIKVGNDCSTYSKTSFILQKSTKLLLLNDQGVLLANFENRNQRLLGSNGIRLINFFLTENNVLFEGDNKKWYFSNKNDSNFNLQSCITEKNSKYVYDIIIENDTFNLINNQIFKSSSLRAKEFVKSNLANGALYKLNLSHKGFETVVIAGKNQQDQTVASLNNYYEISSCFIDSDSTAFICTNAGLIRVSKEFQNKINAKPQVRIFSVISEHRNTIDSLYFGFTRNFLAPQKEFKVKQGRSIIITPWVPENLLCGSILYSYKFGSEGGWSKWSENPALSLIRLSPGKNVVAIKVCDVFGNESSDLSITLNIIPNFFQTQFTLIALVILTILVCLTIIRWRNYMHALERFKLESIINRRTEELVKEKEKTDNLLERVLPRETATELKETGKVNTQKFNMVTVLFSDIQGFTRITDDMNPENLIDQLDRFFLYFDSVVEKYKIEKIKTIGDAYMCAGGIPHKNRTNPVEVVLAALEMNNYMHTINREHKQLHDIWDLRIGIDTGPVIAGVVGRSKLSYDIWGTTVNTASRMESSGEVGKINISGNTYILVQDYFLCTYRGKMPIKNKGDIEMYFVDGIKPNLSDNNDIFRPNTDFLLQLQFLRFGDLEEFILEKLEKGLPKNLYYHNLKHTIDVYTQVELIGRSENVTQEEQLLLQTAALFHDSGHLIDYDTHEEMGVKLAREILPDYQYSERQIEIISELILVTKLPPKPKNLLEAIMCDADLDYLGRTDFIPVSNTLYKELHEHGRIGTIKEWNEMQIKFIEKHQYFTNTARRLRNVNKKSQLENIKQWMEENKL